MSLFLRLLAAFFGGFALHRFYHPSLSLPERWANLTRYAIGGFGLWPFLLMMHHALRKIENDDERVSISYLLSLVFVGAGVTLGHFFDRIEFPNEDK